MQKTQTFCDRCGIEIRDRVGFLSIYPNRLRLRILNKVFGGIAVMSKELCDKCAEDLNQWLENKEV